MRDILFRGKRKDTGEWVYGNYLYDGVYKKHYLTKPGEFCGEVIPETVGQYAGMKDKNGNKIFEGDFVRYANCVHKVVFESRNGNGYFGIVISEIETWPFGSSPANQMEVIGNIHDNPEMLETAKKFWR